MSFPHETATEARRHELLADVAEQTALRLISGHGMEEDAAEDVGNAIADFLADHWKGQSIYLPGDQAFKLNARDWEIFRRFERGNSNELAREFGVSKVRIHQIYKRCLAEYRARTQGGLFEEDQTPPADASAPKKEHYTLSRDMRGDNSRVGRPAVLPDRRFPLQDEFSPDPVEEGRK